MEAIRMLRLPCAIIGHRPIGHGLIPPGAPRSCPACTLICRILRSASCEFCKVL